MSKCSLGCTCQRHVAHSPTCELGCTCKRHKGRMFLYRSSAEEHVERWHSEHPESAQLARRAWKNRHLWDAYGMSSLDYADLLQKQGGVCAICGEINSNGQRLGVDHTHQTGRIRGLLCSTCNRALGLLKDDAATLRRAARYLEGETT